MDLEYLAKLDCEGLLSRLDSTIDIREKNEIIIAIGNLKSNGFCAYDTLETYIGTKLRNQTLIAMGKIDYANTLGKIVTLFRTEEGNKNLDRNIDALSYIFSNRIELMGIDRFIEELHGILSEYLNQGNYLDDPIKRKISRSLRDGVKKSKKEKYLDQARQALYL